MKSAFQELLQSDGLPTLIPTWTILSPLFYADIEIDIHVDTGSNPIKRKGPSLGSKCCFGRSPVLSFVCLSYSNVVVYLNQSIPSACKPYSAQNFAKCDCILIWEHLSDRSVPQSEHPFDKPFFRGCQPTLYLPAIYPVDQWGAPCNPSTQKLQLSRCSAQTATATLNFPVF